MDEVGTPKLDETINPEPQKPPMGLMDQYRQSIGELLDLDDKQVKKLKRRLKKEIAAWKNDTAPLHAKLKDDNDLVEGVIEDTDFPWPGASNIHIDVTAIYMKVYHVVQTRSILGAENIWYGEVDPSTQDSGITADMSATVDSSINYSARYDWNIADKFSEVFSTTNRDGLGVMQVVYDVCTEQSKDVLLITSPEEFFSQFPSPDESGVDPQEYQQSAEMAQQATELEPMEMPVTFEKVTYAGPRAEVIELADFVVFPATAPDIEVSRGYGKRFRMRRGLVKKNKVDGLWYDKAVDRVLSRTRKGSAVNEYLAAKDEIEGLARGATNDDLEFFELILKVELDKEGGERKLLLTYSMDCDELMAAKDYPYRVDNYAFFRIETRPNRLIGNSIPNQTRYLNEEIDTQHNQRINSRTITSVPSFKGKRSMKADLDLNAEENKWKPGVVFWMDDPDTFNQFTVQPVDLGESLSEETNDMKLLDLLLGSSVAVLSGQVAPGDPNAPGNKTAMQIGQSNMRMEDMLAELRKGVEKVGEIVLSHIYQFGPTFITFTPQDGPDAGQTKTVHRKFLRNGIKMRMAGVTVARNPEEEMQTHFQLYQALMMEPLFAQNPDGRIAVLRDALKAGRKPGIDRILPSPQQIEQQRVQDQQKAMMMQQAQEAQAQQDKVKGNLAQARQQIAIKHVAGQLANQNLNGSTIPPPNGGQNGAPTPVAQ